VSDDTAACIACMLSVVNVVDDDVKIIASSSGNRQRFLLAAAGADSHVNLQTGDDAPAANKC